MTGIHDIPQEILHHIFNHLPTDMLPSFFHDPYLAESAKRSYTKYVSLVKFKFPAIEANSISKSIVYDKNNFFNDEPEFSYPTYDELVDLLKSNNLKIKVLELDEDTLIKSNIKDVMQHVERIKINKEIKDPKLLPKKIPIEVDTDDERCIKNFLGPISSRIISIKAPLGYQEFKQITMFSKLETLSNLSEAGFILHHTIQADKAMYSAIHRTIHYPESLKKIACGITNFNVPLGLEKLKFGSFSCRSSKNTFYMDLNNYEILRTIEVVHSLPLFKFPNAISVLLITQIKMHTSPSFSHLQHLKVLYLKANFEMICSLLLITSKLPNTLQELSVIELGLKKNSKCGVSRHKYSKTFQAPTELKCLEINFCKSVYIGRIVLPDLEILNLKKCSFGILETNANVYVFNDSMENSASMWSLPESITILRLLDTPYFKQLTIPNNVRVLELENCQITDFNQTLNNLEELYLTNNPIHSFIPSRSHFPYLVKLDLSNAIIKSLDEHTKLPVTCRILIIRGDQAITSIDSNFKFPPHLQGLKIHVLAKLIPQMITMLNGTCQTLSINGKVDWSLRELNLNLINLSGLERLELDFYRWGWLTLRLDNIPSLKVLSLQACHLETEIYHVNLLEIYLKDVTVAKILKLNKSIRVISGEAKVR